MNAASQPVIGQPKWALAAVGAAAGHLALATAIALNFGGTPTPEPVPEPVMVVELPQGMAAAPIAQAQTPETPVEPQQLPQMVTPRFEAPVVDAPLPTERVALPTPQPITPRRLQPVTAPQPITRAPPPAQQTASASTARGDAGDGAGDNPAARDDANNWYALISAHLEREKRYPREARQAAQQGTPSVRFSVDRRGRVSNVSISRSSGSDLLDDATISLMRRVSPLPAMPRSMQRESVTITLPIEYSLSRK